MLSGPLESLLECGPMVSALSLPSPVGTVQTEADLGLPYQTWLWGSLGDAC